MKHRDLTPEERELWLETAGGVKSKPTAKVKPKSPEISVASAPKKSLPPALALGDAKGLDKRRASLKADATLDLHDMTQDKAHALVVTFIKRAVSHDYRTLLIITGKGRQGGGVLRTNVPKWLDTPQLRPFILAITYASPKEGGEGALRVLLKRQR